MTIPSWATSVVSNYRRMFKEKFGTDFVGTDEVIFQAFENARASNDQDEWILQEMEEYTC